MKSSITPIIILFSNLIGVVTQSIPISRQAAPGQRWKRYGRDPKGATIIADDAVAGRAGSKRQTAVNALPAWLDSPQK